MISNPFKHAQLELYQQAEQFIKEQMDTLNNGSTTIMHPNSRFRLHKQYYNNENASHWSQEQIDEWNTLLPLPGYEDDVRLLRLRVNAEATVHESTRYRIIAYNKNTSDMVRLTLSDVIVCHPEFVIELADVLFNHLQTTE